MPTGAIQYTKYPSSGARKILLSNVTNGDNKETNGVRVYAACLLGWPTHLLNAIMLSQSVFKLCTKKAGINCRCHGTLLKKM